MTQQDKRRLAVLVLLVLGITALHYSTTTQWSTYHDIYRRLYYIPIVFGGLWFLLRGGLGTSIAISILYAPHVVFQWGHHPSTRPEQYLEILLYNVIGFITGFLAQRERLQKDRYQTTASELEKSYSQLKHQADLILEIEEQLRRADRLSALGELSAGMAHEIRNPLGSIRGTAEILQEGLDPSDRRAEFGRILLKEVDRLNRVVEDFLHFAKPAPAERGRFTVGSLVQEVVQLTSRQAEKSRVEIETDLRDSPMVLGDAGQIRQAFLNLVLNAIQAMSDGGRLQISTRRRNGSVLVAFADDGPGISPENMEKIFNPFFTTRQEGIGLGLAITHRIIQGNDGSLEVESHLGRGTTFTVCLPAADAEGTDPRRSCF